MLLGVTRDTEVAFGKFPYFPYQTETFRYGMVWEWYGKRIRFPIPYHTVVRHIQAFLFPKEDDEDLMKLYNKEDEEGVELGEKEKKNQANNIWNRIGVIGKLHNIIIYS